MVRIGKKEKRKEIKEKTMISKKRENLEGIE